jgi:hypothetical protein
MSDSESDLRLEIGHVLFIDIVGYSRLLIEEQKERLNQLTEIVLATAPVREATDEKLVRLPTGDGVALVFRRSVEGPARCALEIAEALQKHPELPVRMGIHSGPVSEVTDVSGRINVAGAGINMAQRVMDCGDAGHILLSQHVADDLVQYRQWAPRLRDLGECEVKHGIRLHLVNLYAEPLGNAALPQKFQQAKPTPAPRSSLGWIAALALVAILAGAAVFLFHSYGERKQITNVSATAAPQTQPTAAPPSASVAPSPAPAAPAVVPAQVPEQPSVVTASPLAEEYQNWKKLTLITWDNSYLIDHARERYPAWRRAADSGDAIGQFFVGYSYQHGLTVREDLTTAFDWFTKSAAQKNSDAMFEVAMCSALGIGTQQNVLVYARWINEAVASGNSSAEVAMGVGMMLFPVNPTDKEQGKQHIAKAAAAGNLDAVFWDALVNSNSPAQMTAELQKAAAAGQPDSLITLVENNPGNPEGRSMVGKALKMMGNPLMVARIIDPTLPGGFYHKNVFPDLTATRLREMSKAGSAEATRLLTTLTKAGKF